MIHSIVHSSLLSSINVYFKDDQFIALKRHELYGWVDFIANSGGLVGLFMGFSFVSIIEIVYYIVLLKYKEDLSIEDPKTFNNEGNNSIFINVRSISDDFENIPKFNYLP